MNIAILGACWGDEGKGHITHHLSQNYDWVIRFNGGANAGHTIYQEINPWNEPIKLVHNLLPSIDFYWTNPKNPNAPKTRAFLGSGMVIDLEKLREEILELESKLYSTFQSLDGASIGNRVYVDPDAFVVLPAHKEEDKATNGHIGSTNRGIGPAYKDKIGRTGTRIKNLIKVGHPHIKALQDLGVQFKHVMELEREFSNDNLLFEGAQGILLDINHGIYPYVSCSDCTIAGIISSGFSFAKLDRVYGVAKCYTTKVGEGPFPTELQGKEAEELRKRGNEYGATTGRPRRVGWVDLPAIRYACKKAGITNLILTKFDILNGMEEVPVCIGYENIHTQRAMVPVCPADFFEAKPVYGKICGWSACDHNQLYPFISAVEHGAGVVVSYISCGTGSADIITT